MYMKTCTRCRQQKPFDAFYAKETNPRTGHTQYISQCKECKRSSYVSRAKPKVPVPTPTEKLCKVCNTVKPIASYYKHSNTCKSCISDKNRANRVPKVPKPYSMSLQAIRKRKYREENKLFYLRSHIGTCIANALSHKGHTKRKPTVDILGCTIEELKIHLESQFLPGMTWDNRQLWHIDHIVPQKLATTEEQVIMLNHYTNLRPLWGVENQAKAASITEDVKKHPLYTKLYTP